MKYLNIYLMDEESNIVQTQQLNSNHEINCHQITILKTCKTNIQLTFFYFVYNVKS